MKDNPNLKLYSHDRNLGLGAALKTGFDYAQCELVFFTAADGQLPPDELKKFIDNFSDCDMLISVYEKREDAFIRHIISFVWRILLRTILHYNLEIAGPYLFRKDLLRGIPLYSKTGLINFEFPNKVKNAGFRIKAISIKCRQRLSGKSKVLNFKTIFRTIREMFIVRLKSRKK